MGLESYRLTIEFEQPVCKEELISLLSSVGMTHLSNNYSNQDKQEWTEHFFEIRTHQGLIEVHCLLAPNDAASSSFSLRFSIASPSTVIAQTFNFLSVLHVLRPVRIYDTEIRHHIYRRLRQEGKVDMEFKWIEGAEEDSTIENMCYIPINQKLFEQNPLGIMKRQTILNNSRGAILEGGDKTFEYVDKKGAFEQLMGWIMKEL